MKIKLLENSQLSACRSRGFTLIELMITLLIVAILSGIAYPSYRNYVIRGQIVDATQGLSTLRANMERFYQDNRTYATVGAFISPCANPYVVGTFTLQCVGTLDANNFTAQAQGTAGQLVGFVYTVNQLDVQTTTITSPAPSAWIITCATSWSTKAGSC
jgi:type IV pilus assembly protein PilE